METHVGGKLGDQLKLLVVFYDGVISNHFSYFIELSLNGINCNLFVLLCRDDFNFARALPRIAILYRILILVLCLVAQQVLVSVGLLAVRLVPLVVECLDHVVDLRVRVCQGVVALSLLGFVHALEET